MFRVFHLRETTVASRSSRDGRYPTSCIREIRSFATALARWAWARPNGKLGRSISFSVVSALLRIPSTHFSAPLLRDVTAELIEQLKERRNLRAGCPLSIVDFDAHCEDPDIVFLPANTERGLQDTRDFFDGP